MTYPINFTQKIKKEDWYPEKRPSESKTDYSELTIDQLIDAVYDGAYKLPNGNHMLVSRPDAVDALRARIRELENKIESLQNRIDDFDVVR